VKLNISVDRNRHLSTPLHLRDGERPAVSILCIKSMSELAGCQTNHLKIITQWLTEPDCPTIIPCRQLAKHGVSVKTYYVVQLDLIPR
jgi:hypothetical protein